MSGFWERREQPRGPGLRDGGMGWLADKPGGADWLRLHTIPTCYNLKRSPEACQALQPGPRAAACPTWHGASTPPSRAPPECTPASPTTFYESTQHREQFRARPAHPAHNSSPRGTTAHSSPRARRVGSRPPPGRPPRPQHGWALLNDARHARHPPLQQPRAGAGAAGVQIVVAHQGLHPAAAQARIC